MLVLRCIGPRSTIASVTMRICKVRRILLDIPIQVNPACDADGVFGDEPSPGGVVVPCAVEHQACGGAVVFASGELIGVIGGGSGGGGDAIGVVGVGRLVRRAVAEGDGGAKEIGEHQLAGTHVALVNPRSRQHRRRERSLPLLLHDIVAGIEIGGRPGSLGSADVTGWPKIGRTSTPKPAHSSCSSPSGSWSEGSVALEIVLGQTLKGPRSIYDAKYSPLRC